MRANLGKTVARKRMDHVKGKLREGYRRVGAGAGGTLRIKLAAR